MIKEYDIAVVGTGVTATLLASVLNKSGFEVVLLKHKPRVAPLVKKGGIREYSINHFSKEILWDNGVWRKLGNNIGSFSKIEAFDNYSEQHISFENYNRKLEPLGYVVNEHLLASSVQSISSNVESFSAEFQITCNDDSGNIFRLDGIGSIKTKVAVLCDSGSRLVNNYFRPHLCLDYSELAIVADVQTSASHENIARQWFSNLGILALLPKTDKNKRSMIYSLDKKVASKLVADDGVKLEKIIGRITESSQGKIMIDGTLESYPLYAGVATSWEVGRLILIGGAAHSFHPLAGQGLNVTVADIACLAETLSSRGINKTSISHYVKKRRRESLKMLYFTDLIYKVFNVKNSTFAMMRGLGLKKLNKKSLLKALLSKEASGY